MGAFLCSFAGAMAPMLATQTTGLSLESVSPASSRESFVSSHWVDSRRNNAFHIVSMSTDSIDDVNMEDFMEATAGYPRRPGVENSRSGSIANSEQHKKAQHKAAASKSVKEPSAARPIQNPLIMQSPLDMQADAKTDAKTVTSATATAIADGHADHISVHSFSQSENSSPSHKQSPSHSQRSGQSDPSDALRTRNPVLQQSNSRVIFCGTGTSDDHSVRSCMTNLGLAVHDLRNMDHVMHHPLSAGFLHRFCVAHYCSESMGFIMAVDQFREIFDADSSAWRHHTWKSLDLEHIPSTATLPSVRRLKKEMEEALAQCTSSSTATGGGGISSSSTSTSSALPNGKAVCRFIDVEK